jgi:hypothetical protein
MMRHAPESEIAVSSSIANISPHRRLQRGGHAHPLGKPGELQPSPVSNKSIARILDTGGDLTRSESDREVVHARKLDNLRVWPVNTHRSVERFLIIELLLTIEQSLIIERLLIILYNSGDSGNAADWRWDCQAKKKDIEGADGLFPKGHDTHPLGNYSKKRQHPDQSSSLQAHPNLEISVSFPSHKL